MADPLWADFDAGLNTPEYNGREMRRGESASWWHSGTTHNFGARGGIVRAQNAGEVTVSGMTVTVADINVVIYPSTSNSQSGSYRGSIPSTVLTVPAADGSLPRVDLVVARVFDTNEDSSGEIDLRCEIVVGTPNSSPVPPGTPTNAIALATVSVPAGSTSPTLTMVAPYTTSSGGILPNRTPTDFPTTGLHEGQYADAYNDDGLYRWTGTEWQVVASNVQHRTGRAIVGSAGQNVAATARQTGTSFGSLSGGPSVTVNIRENGRALIHFGARYVFTNDTTIGRIAQLRISMTGANTGEIADNQAEGRNTTPNLTQTVAGFWWATGLNPGSTTFTLQYQQSSPSAEGCDWDARSIFVQPM